MSKVSEMKDSNIEFVGLIPEDWDTYKNKYLFNSKKAIVGDSYIQYQLLSLTTKGVIKKDINNTDGKLPETFGTYQLVNANDLILCLFDLDVSAVFSGISNYDGMISPAYKVISCKSHVYPKFADYWFRAVGDDRNYLIYSKSLRNTINADNFKEIPMILPSFEKQQRITGYLDEKIALIDNIIHKTKDSIEEYKGYKQAVITETVTKGFNPDIRMKESNIEWIGKIPEDWNIVPLKYLFNLNKGLNITKDDLVSQGISVVSYGQIHSKENLFYKLNPDLIRYVSDSYAIKNQNSRILLGDFVFADTSEDLEGVGNFVRNNNQKEILAGYHTIIASMKVPSLGLSDYFSFLFMSDAFRAQVRAQVTGIKLYSITQKILKKSYVLVPPIDVCYLINDYLCEKMKTINRLISEKSNLIIELQLYKKSLIYECVTGKKEVK